jgi:acetyl esterase/lipase
VDFVPGDDHASRVENASGYLLTAEDMRWFGDHYLSDVAHAEDPRASVLKAPDLSGVAAAVVATAEYDPLRDEGEAYATALEAAGVHVVAAATTADPRLLRPGPVSPPAPRPCASCAPTSGACSAQG